MSASEQRCRVRAATVDLGFNGRPWRVSQVHCVVGPIQQSHWSRIAEAWLHAMRMQGHTKVRSPHVLVRAAFDYFDCAAAQVTLLRALSKPVLFFTNDPLIVNELQPEEVTLACLDEGRLVLTSFADLPEIDLRMKVYVLGELWLAYANGGAELPLRQGGPRP